MKNFHELAKERHSVRNFQNRPVEKEKLMYVLEAGRMAPSAANFQPWYFIVITNMGMRQKLALTYNREWFIQAPAVIVVCGDHDCGWKRFDGKDHTDIDIAIAVDHMTLAAAEIGLGTCWVCNFDVKKAKEVLELTPSMEPIVYLPIGYPTEGEENVHPHHHKRRLMTQIVHWEKFDASKKL